MEVFTHRVSSQCVVISISINPTKLMPNIIETNKVIHIKTCTQFAPKHTQKKREKLPSHTMRINLPPSPKHKKNPIHTKLTFDHK